MNKPITLSLFAFAITPILLSHPEPPDEYMAKNARSLTDIVFESTPERVARGKYLTNGPMYCFHCHSEREESLPGAPIKKGRLGSGRVIDESTESRMIAPNLTPDNETGTGTWTDDMLARAIREGVGHDGRALMDFMPYRDYRNVSDEDIRSIVVYLRSLDPIYNQLPTRLLPKKVGLSALRFPRPITEPIPEQDFSDPVARGKFLVQIGECQGCHTSWEHRNPGNLGGGFEMYKKDPVNGGKIFTANISSHVTGIGALTLEGFMMIIRTGKNGTLDKKMPWQVFKNMTDEDLAAIFAFLKTSMPVKHQILNGAPPTYCEVCEQNHGLGELNKIEELTPFDLNYEIPWDISGDYSNANGQQIATIKQVNSRWMLSYKNLEPSPIVAAAENKFRSIGVNSYFSFEYDENGNVTVMLLHGLNEARFKKNK